MAETRTPVSPRRASSDEGRGRAPRAVIITVHGTWATGAPWAKADSPLARTVVKWFAGRGTTATVVPFEWSGRNSITARRAAGAKLAELIDQVRSDDDPPAALYLIAHSHGGSVFAYATKLRPDLVKEIDGFVALATPWIGMQPCSYAAALRAMLVQLTLFTVFAMVILAPLILFLSRTPFVPLTDEDLLAIRKVFQSLRRQFPHMLLWWLVYVAAIGSVLFALQRFVSRRTDKAAPAFRHRLNDIARQSSVLVESLPSSVFLKPIGDEAALALAWTGAMAALMQAASTLLFVSLEWIRHSWNRVPRTLRISGGLVLSTAWALGVVAAAGVLVFAAQVSLSEALRYLRATVDLLPLWMRLFYSASIIWALVSCVASILIVSALFGVLVVALLAAAFAGVPSFKTAMYFRISVEPVPVGSRELVLVDVSSPPPGGLSHSALYNSPGAIRAVVEAFEGFENARTAKS